MNSPIKYWICLIVLTIFTLAPPAAIIVIGQTEPELAGAITPPGIMVMVAIVFMWRHALKCPGCGDSLGWHAECEFNRDFDFGLSEEAGDRRCPPHPWYARAFREDCKYGPPSAKARAGFSEGATDAVRLLDAAAQAGQAIERGEEILRRRNAKTRRPPLPSEGDDQ